MPRNARSSRPDRRKRTLAAAALALVGGLLLSGCQAIGGAADFVQELGGGEVRKSVRDADGNEYAILKGRPMGEAVGESDSDYRRNVQFPDGLPDEVQEWSELSAGELFAKLDEAGMVAEDVPVEEAEAAVTALARATTTLNQVLLDSTWLDARVSNEEIMALMPDGVVQDNLPEMLETSVLRGWDPEASERVYVLPPLIHDGYNRFAQSVDEDGEPIAPLGAFTIAKAPDYGANAYAIEFPAIRYHYRASQEEFGPYAEWMYEHGAVRHEDEAPFETADGEETESKLISLEAGYTVYVSANDDWSASPDADYRRADGFHCIGAGGTWGMRSLAVREE